MELDESGCISTYMYLVATDPSSSAESQYDWTCKSHRLAFDPAVQGDSDPACQQSS